MIGNATNTARSPNCAVANGNMPSMTPIRGGPIIIRRYGKNRNLGGSFNSVKILTTTHTEKINNTTSIPIAKKSAK